MWNISKSASVYNKKKMTSEEHNRYLSLAFIGHAAFQGFFAILMIAMVAMFLSLEPGRGGPPPKGFFLVIFGFMFLFHMAFVVPSIDALRKKRPWARTASIDGTTKAI